jgi:hypothetical protein
VHLLYLIIQMYLYVYMYVYICVHMGCTCEKKYFIDFAKHKNSSIFRKKSSFMDKFALKKSHFNIAYICMNVCLYIPACICPSVCSYQHTYIIRYVCHLFFVPTYVCSFIRTYKKKELNQCQLSLRQKIFQPLVQLVCSWRLIELCRILPLFHLMSESLCIS